VDYFHSARQVIDEAGRPISGILRPVPAFKLSDLEKGNFIGHLHCWRVSAALAIGGMDESLGPHGADDYDFPWCMAEAGYRFRAIPERLYYYRDHLAHYRLTTHVPVSVQIGELAKIYRKHRIPEARIRRLLRMRSDSDLRQALYEEEGCASRSIVPARLSRWLSRVQHHRIRRFLLVSHNILMSRNLTCFQKFTAFGTNLLVSCINLFRSIR
jgi:hypothetical protein